MDWTTIIVASVSGLLTGGLGIAIANGIFGKNKSAAEAKKLLAEAKEVLASADHQSVESALELVKSMQERVNTVNERLDRLEKERDADRKYYEAIIEKLEIENKELREKISGMEAERLSQIKTNRQQGQRIAELLKRLGELENKSNGTPK
jgi:DNA repair exonuclease SbcCD ATPase subunit